MQQQEARIKNLFYALFGGTFFILLVLLGGYFGPPSFGYRKLQTDIQAKEADITTQKTTADGLGQAQVAYVKAQVDSEAVEAQLAYFRNRYFALDLGNRDVLTDNDALYPAFNKWLAIYRDGSPRLGVPIGGYGRQLQSELDFAVQRSGVAYAASAAGTNGGGASPSPSGGTEVGGTTGRVDRPAVAIPPDLAPKNPEDVRQPGFIPANGLLKPVATINMAVRGDLGSILRFFQIITSSRSAIVKTVSSMKLDGTSPDLVASFSLTPYLVIRGKNAVITATSGAATGAAATTGGASAITPTGNSVGG